MPPPGALAQLVAHLLCKQGVRGSSPLGSTDVVSTARSRLCAAKGPKPQVATTFALVKKSVGMGIASSQVMAMGRSPSCRT